MTETSTHALCAALGDCAGNLPLQNGVTGLLNALGYSSERTINVGSVKEFLKDFATPHNLTDLQRELFKPWKTVDIVFQFTEGEIASQFLPSDTRNFDRERIESFLFLTVDMVDKLYTRTELAQTTRAVNRFFAMPVIILFRHGLTLTLAAIHRRAHRQDHNRDVLGKVTLVKDIRTKEPHRAHIEILSELDFKCMIASGVRSFDELHEKWEKVLDIEILNKRFYRELFQWFERAINECKFPYDGAGNDCNTRHIIRLITRLLFIWFLKEKGLVPEALFEDEFAQSTLRNHAPDRTDYYRAILQNLFFATLNTEVEKRIFGNNESTPLRDHRKFNEYRYCDLLIDPDAFVKKLKRVPFVNGGLFDCLDSLTAASGDDKLIDAFTDRPTESLSVPAHLFFDPEYGLFAIFRRYKFTVEESTPLDQEVALDPELLGLVFENLLAAYNPETRETARKATGSYYTPRSLVDYMVRETLTEALAAIGNPSDGDTSFWRERLKYLLDHSDAMGDADQLFEEADRRTVVSAIAQVRTLDPAVGSGAFPMGILQTLTLALRRLDPDNMIWEEIQKEQAKAKARKAFDEESQELRDEALSEISYTFERYRQSDFGRKLYLIQNGIYGIDIQPIACQVAKLRFFISLIIEQNPDPNAPNVGIKPLPNLETKLVAADSLLSLKPETNNLLQYESIASKQREVQDVRANYFLANSQAEKLRYMRADKCRRRELMAMLESEYQERLKDRKQHIENRAVAFPSVEARRKFREVEYREFNVWKQKYHEILSDARKIAKWDPYDQNTKANWFCAEYMFGVSDGFDIVIGNPPYIQLQKNRGYAGKLYCGVGYKTFQRKGDIYQLFYELGAKLLKKDTGVLAYITSNSWLKAEYGKPLRQWFAEHYSPLQLIEMGKGVFKNAIVDTAILIINNDKDHPATCRAVDLDQISEKQFPPLDKNWGTLHLGGAQPWLALTSVERDVMEKMETVGTPLKNWDISIYRGILTGYNDAFIVDTATRDRMIAEDPASEEILKPVLRGRDIARYRANWDDRWLISIFPSLSLDIELYPAIKKHLLSFGKERLAQDGRQLPGGDRTRKKTSNAWYELQDTCAYYGEFLKTKLFWMHMTPYGKFALVKPGVVCNQKCFMITGMEIEYLCFALNSSLVTWFVRHTAVTTGMGLIQWDKFTVESIPLVQPDYSTSEIAEYLVKSILTAIESGDIQTVKKFQRRIDSYIYEIYGLTTKERDLVSSYFRSL